VISNKILKVSDQKVKDFIKPYKVYVGKYRMGLNPTEILPLYWHVIKKKNPAFPSFAGLSASLN